MAGNTVRMYACGPTVYDYGHIGNFRTFVAVDLLRRFLRQSGCQLDHVMNITDVEDKIIRNAAREGKSVQEYTRKYEEAFLEDMQTLNLERPEQILDRASLCHGFVEVDLEVDGHLVGNRIRDTKPLPLLAALSDELVHTATSASRPVRTASTASRAARHSDTPAASAASPVREAR